VSDREELRELQSAVAAAKTVILVGEMEAYYEGRSTSWLGRGERLLIIKQDRSVLVHRPSGYEPVNWQPPGSHIELSSENGRLIFTSTRSSPPERLRITIYKVIHFSAFKLRDEAVFQLHANEGDMKEAVLLDPSIVEEGFRVVEAERKVRGGFIDILGVDRHGRVVVVEVKRGRAGVQDVAQLARYASQVGEELGERPRQLLLAPVISARAASMARTLGVEFRSLSPRKAFEIIRRKRGLDRFIQEKR